MSNNKSLDNTSDFNTPPEQLFPVFPNSNESFNTPPQDLFPNFQYDNPATNSPSVFVSPPINNQPTNNPTTNNSPVNNQPQNPRPNNEVLYEQDMQELLRVEAEENEIRRAREAYLRAKRARRNARQAWRIENGIDPVPSSEDDSSASSNEGYVSDDSFN